MNSIISAVRNAFNTKASMLTMPESAIKFVPKAEPLPLDIYGDLPAMPEDASGPTGKALFELIAAAFPETSANGFEYASVRHNRRELYKSIHFLRTESKRKWGYDVQVMKGDYTKDTLLRHTAKTVNLH